MKTLMISAMLTLFSSQALADQICTAQTFDFKVLTYGLAETNDDENVTPIHERLASPVAGLVKFEGLQYLYTGTVAHFQTRVGELTTYQFSDDQDDQFTIEQRTSFLFLPCGRGSCPEPQELTTSKLTYQGQTHDLTCTPFAL